MLCVLYVEPAGTWDSLSGSKVGAGKGCGWGTEVGMNSDPEVVSQVTRFQCLIQTNVVTRSIQ